MSHEDVQRAILNNDHHAMDDSMAKKGLHINAAVDSSGGSALNYAAWAGSEVCAEHLLEGRADPDQQNQWGSTGLLSAAANGHVGSARLLLEAGADPRHKDKDGFTALDLAKRRNHHEVVRLLVPCPAISPPARQAQFLFIIF